jgi:hypothetical protein
VFESALCGGGPVPQQTAHTHGHTAHTTPTPALLDKICQGQTPRTPASVRGYRSTSARRVPTHTKPENENLENTYHTGGCTAPTTKWPVVHANTHTPYPARQPTLRCPVQGLHAATQARQCRRACGASGPAHSGAPPHGAGTQARPHPCPPPRLTKTTPSSSPHRPSIPHTRYTLGARLTVSHNSSTHTTNKHCTNTPHYKHALH